MRATVPARCSGRLSRIRRSALRLFSKWVLVLCATILWAQDTTLEPRFAVEIPGPDGRPPHYVILQERAPLGQSSLVSCGSLHRLQQPDAIGDGRPRPGALQLGYEVKGDAVVVTVSVLFGVCDERDTLTWRQGSSEEKLATYSLRLDESVKLKELEQVGN